MGCIFTNTGPAGKHYPNNGSLFYFFKASIIEGCVGVGIKGVGVGVSVGGRGRLGECNSVCSVGWVYE